MPTGGRVRKNRHIFSPCSSILRTTEKKITHNAFLFQFLPCHSLHFLFKSIPLCVAIIKFSKSCSHHQPKQNLCHLFVHQPRSLKEEPMGGKKEKLPCRVEICIISH
jgi:hypothetical protein